MDRQERSVEVQEQGREANTPYEMPDLECDLVMKGGVPSGVVYPSALRVLARHYRFRSIGGTSAGAIAAAGAAAAQYGRISGGVGGLGRVEEGMKEGGVPERNLLQATPEIRPLVEAIFDLRNQPAPA